MELLEREVAGQVRMRSQRDSGDTPLCLVPTPSLATSPSNTLGSKYSPEEPCLKMPRLGDEAVKGAPPA
eukprot:10032511-Heterocapsa_arctica.AAC.1